MPPIKKSTTKVVRSKNQSQEPTAEPVQKVASADSDNPKTSKPLFDTVVDTAKKLLRSRGNSKREAGTAKTALKPESESEPKPTAATSPSLPPAASRPSKKIETPAILLEGDRPAATGMGGPGEKYSLGATPPAQTFSGGELPESYGTKKLFLTARDPHWLYAHWDLTREQQNKFNAESTDGHLVLRVYVNRIEGHPISEIHVHPESRHWFAHVELAGNSYAAELGYYSSIGKWMRVAASSSTCTPPDAVAVESETEFATIPFEFPFAKLMQIIEQAVAENLPLAQAIEGLRRHGHPDLPRINGTPVFSWTPQQEQALARIISIDETRRVWMGSLEITELIRLRLAHGVTSPMTGFGAPGPAGPTSSSPGISSVTSPFGGAFEKSKNFWFTVNAELIIYGATEPDAKVTLGGHEIKLRNDGTFSFRFALPDGVYDLPAVAISACGDDARAADLRFSRETHSLGDVGAHPQDPSLKAPLPQNL